MIMTLSECPESGSDGARYVDESLYILLRNFVFLADRDRRKGHELTGLHRAGCERLSLKCKAQHYDRGCQHFAFGGQIEVQALRPFLFQMIGSGGGENSEEEEDGLEVPIYLL